MPGRNKWAIVLGWVLVVVAAVMGTASARSGEKPGSAGAAPGPPPEPEIIISGKCFCSLKRRVDLPFAGVITSLKAQPGQKVVAGETLATYRLTPEALFSIRQRLAPPQISDTEVKLAEVERTLASLHSKQRELQQLAQKKLAPIQSLTQIDREVQLVGKEREALRERLRQDRQLAREDLAVISKQLGNSLKSGQVQAEAALKAPISGHLIRVSPELREDAELPATPGIMLVGVMDPMVVQAQAFEIEALQISLGQAAEVTIDSLPGKKFAARVNRLSWAALTGGLDQPSYYEVELEVPNRDLVIKEGLKARITIRKPGKEAS